MIATHVCGSSYLRKYSSRDESDASTSQSLEEIAVRNAQFCLWPYICHTLLLGSVTGLCKETWYFRVFSRGKQVGPGVSRSAGYLLALTLQIPLPEAFHHLRAGGG